MRIRFDGDGESAQRVGELRFRRRAFGGSGILRRDCARTGLSHRVECLAFVRGVALNRVDEIGNEISAPFELHVDVRPRVLRANAE